MSSSSIERRSGPAPSARGKSRLELTFTRAKGESSYLSHQYASHPFHVCRAQYLDRAPSGLASLYIQSSAGGLYEGDRLEIAISAEAGAQAHVTTQASSIVHRSRGPAAHQDVALRSETAVAGADGTLLVLDRIDVTGAEALTPCRGIMGVNQGQGIMLIVSRDEGDAQTLPPLLREALAALPGVYAGVSALPNGAGLSVRILGADGDALKTALEVAWAEARRVFTGAYPARRRK
jgi:urease accessory protein UreH